MYCAEQHIHLYYYNNNYLIISHQQPVYAKNNMSNKNTNHHSTSLSTYQLEVFEHFSCIAETDDVITTVDTKTNCHLFLCPLCGDEPGYYRSYDGTSDVSPHVHFSCYSCPYQWMLCRLCSCDMQPTLLKKRDQRRNIKNIFNILQSMMMQHTMEHHSSQQHESYFNNIEDDTVSYTHLTLPTSFEV